MRLIAALFAAGLLVSAVSGPEEDAAHARADAVDAAAAGERGADGLERQAAATSHRAQETALNDQGDAVEHAADRHSDDMHRQLDKDH